MNIDCNLQTAKAKPATANDVSCSAKQTTHRHSFTDIVYVIFLENCQSNSKYQKIGVHNRLPYIQIRVITGSDCAMIMLQLADVPLKARNTQ